MLSALEYKLDNSIYEQILSDVYCCPQVTLINSTCVEYLDAGPGCDHLFGNYQAVYKACSGQLSLHLVLMIITICASNSSVIPGVIHNG